MWHCLKCHEEVEDSFDICWNCGTALGGNPDPSFQKAGEMPTRPDGTPHPSFQKADEMPTQPADPEGVAGRKQVGRLGGSGEG
jgi:hypothetical protein